MVIHRRASDICTYELAKGAILNNTFPGFQEDYLVLHCLLKHLKPRTVVEIGTSAGIGTNIICNAVRGALVYSLELPPELASRSPEHPQNRMGCHCEFPYTQLLGDSLEFDFTPYHPVDAWFIDGAHNKHHVSIESQKALASNAVLVAYHDTDIPEVLEGIVDVFDASQHHTIFRVSDTRITFVASDQFPHLGSIFSETR